MAWLQRRRGGEGRHVSHLVLQGCRKLSAERVRPEPYSFELWEDPGEYCGGNYWGRNAFFSEIAVQKVSAHQQQIRCITLFLKGRKRNKKGYESEEAALKSGRVISTNKRWDLKREGKWKTGFTCLSICLSV